MVISETARLKVTIDFRRGPAHNQRMAVSFDTLAAAEALEAVGVEARQARVFATQLHAAARAGEPVTRPELEKSAAELKTEIAEAEGRLEKSIAKVRAELVETEARLEKSIAKTKVDLIDRIDKSEQRMKTLLWQLFGGMVALGALAVAVLGYLL